MVRTVVVASMSDRTTVLHVDDDPEFLSLAARRFDRSADGDPEIELVPAGSADEGMEILDSRRVDCIVSDSIRCADGEPFVAAAHRRDASVPIVLYTANAADAVADEVTGGAVDAYFRKGDGDSLGALGCTVRALVAGDADDEADDASGPSAVDDRTTEETAPAPKPAGTDRAAAGTATLGSDWEIIGRHDWAAPSELGTTIVEAVTAHRNREPEAFGHLYERVDADALADLLGPTFGGRTRPGTQVRFPYLDHELAVTAEGIVAVRPLDRPFAGAEAAEREATVQ